VKLSYSKSFVDAPYIYRKANVMSALMSGEPADDAVRLSPERVHSFQLSFAGSNWVKGLNFEVNGFYNRATDLIMTHVTEYKNASKNQTCGVELMTSYKLPRFTADFNLTWIHTFKSNIMRFGLPAILDEYYSTDIDANNNTPAIMSNLVLAWQANKHLRLHTHVLFEGKQTSYNANLVELVHTISALELYQQYMAEGKRAEAGAAMQSAVEAARGVIMHKDMPARAIVDIGGEYTLGPVTFGLNVHNLLGTRYYRSGMNTNVIPQQGRWFLASIGVRL
jgi:iron complex outermembrane receptor protein